MKQQTLQSERVCVILAIAPQWKNMCTGKKVITHVLKVENLEEEFQDLMKLYKLPVKLEDATMRNEGVLGVDDLSKEAIRKINEWGKLDFEYFGFV